MALILDWPEVCGKEIVEVGVNVILARSWTDEGVKLWWDRVRSKLDNRTPRDALEEGEYQRVIDLAWDGLG